MPTPSLPRPLWTGLLALALLVPLAACGSEPDADDLDSPMDTPVPVVVDTEDPGAAMTDTGDGDMADAASPDPTSDSAADDVSPSLLEGVWDSTEDPLVNAVFSDGLFTELYDGETMNSNPYSISDGCNGGDAPVFAFTTTMDGEATCYSVVTLTDDRLAYSMAGGRGNTLSFVRGGEGGM